MAGVIIEQEFDFKISLLPPVLGNIDGDCTPAKPHGPAWLVLLGTRLARANLLAASWFVVCGYNNVWIGGLDLERPRWPARWLHWSVRRGRCTQYVRAVKNKNRFRINQSACINQSAQTQLESDLRFHVFYIMPI